MVGVLHTDDRPRHGRAGHFQADPVGGVLVDVLDLSDVQCLRREQDVDAERAAFTGDVVEQFRVLGMVGQHQREFVGDHEQRRDRRQVMSGGDRVFVFGHRVERAALHLTSGLAQDHFPTRDLAAQRVGEPVGQRLLLGHVRDHRDDLREVAEDVGAGLTLEVRVDHDQSVGGVSRQQRQQDRHQGLRLARTGHADHQAVRTHPAFGFVFEVEDQRLTGRGDTDRNPQLVVAVPGCPQRRDIKPGCVRDSQQRRESGAAGGRRLQAAVRRIGVPPRQSAREVDGVVGPEMVGAVDVALPAAGLPAVDRTVRDPQDRPFGIGILFAMRCGGRSVHDGDPGPASRQGRGVQVEIRIVDDDQQVPQRISRPAGERRAVGQRRPKQRGQLVGLGGQVAGRSDAVGFARDVNVRQPLQP